MPTLTINGKSVTVDPGTSVLQAAKRAGIAIPHFCYHPYLTVAGNCRMCLVEIEKVPKLAISCATAAADGMVVRSDTDKVRDAVQGVLEFLLLNHPIDCPICDQAGECYLQDYYMLHGLHDSRIPRDDKVIKGKAIDLGPITLDQERCVLCSRCVRYTTEVSKTGELYLCERGDRTEIRTFADRPLTGEYTGNLADVCPVGALTSTDFRFKKRVWYLKPVPSVCPGCATGCSIWVDQADDAVHRLRPRDNPHVNKLWMCDPGRALYREIDTDRVSEPRVEGTEAALDQALQRTAEGLGQEPAAVGILAPASLPLEDMFAAAKLAEALGTPYLASWLLSAQDEPAAHDGILRREDPFPNTRGARELGLTPDDQSGERDTNTLLQAIEAGQVKALLLLGLSHLEASEAGNRLLAALPSVPFTAVVASHAHAALDQVTVVIPGAVWAERDGTYVNADGRLQKFRKAVRAPGAGLPPFSVLLALLRLMGHPLPELVADGTDSARPLFRWLASERAAFDGITYDRIGGKGISLTESEAALAGSTT